MSPPQGSPAVQEPILHWYAVHARDLPWRRLDATPWAILVSEFMLQQTPVTRVLPVYAQWMQRWPAPADLVAAGAGEAVRAWGRLGYPRRALRLLDAAGVITHDHAGSVPDDYGALRALPGVGDYTAAAVASFAFGRRHVVLDTNVRRVLARLVDGVAFPGLAVTRSERQRAESLLPQRPEQAAAWSVAVMELGATLCTASRPGCERCPVSERCRWRLDGHPTGELPRRRPQPYAGSDRQCRGRLLQVLRAASEPVPPDRLLAVWKDEAQWHRAVSSLLADGLAVRRPDGAYTLP